MTGLSRGSAIMTKSPVAAQLLHEFPIVASLEEVGSQHAGRLRRSSSVRRLQEKFFDDPIRGARSFLQEYRGPTLKSQSNLGVSRGSTCPDGPKFA